MHNRQSITIIMIIRAKKTTVKIRLKQPGVKPSSLKITLYFSQIQLHKFTTSHQMTPQHNWN